MSISSYALTLPAYVFAHSRLLQGGALSDREETDAIRELEVRCYMHLERRWAGKMSECIRFSGAILAMHR